MSTAPPAAPPDLQQERSFFNGILVATLAYGALLMLYTQLTQVLLSRPKRGGVYWGVVVYSTLLFCLATIAIGGLMKYAGVSFIDNRLYPPGPVAYYDTHLTNHIHVMSQVCVTLVPWIGDVLMLYRLFVVWNSNWFIVVLPSLLYVSRVAMSIPLLISQTRPKDTWWAIKLPIYSQTFYVLCLSLNLFVTTAICLRIYTMRQRMETTLGRLHASFYTGFVTMLVESGAVFTIWSTAYVALSSQHSVAQDTFLLPYTHVLGITRMLIVLRMAQDRAWSKELAAAACGDAPLDWQPFASHSIPLHDVPASSAASTSKKYHESSF
ncbi:hypothetical protein LshimejAT787_0905560 [Lyophyllum shimeji]|uniref:Uncharacterized protein n=1 Tax=Lyophyllum shimeji TaxID=47721 RepID=A0A9P3PU85_LYOSH|nr:hypothetical protein LshimejAT787_0905560 [Lyophyllum shimeji]